MKVTTIKDVYGQTHELIKKNPLLMERIKDMAAHSTYQRVEQYLPTGLQINGIYLGLDFKPRHINQFLKILVNTIIIDHASSHSADFSRVLLRIMIDGEHVANLTEDVSENGALEIYDKGSLFGPYEDCLKRNFKNDVERVVFIVYQKRELKVREGLKISQPLAIRMPIIDLDHIEPIEMLWSLRQDFE